MSKENMNNDNKYNDNSKFFKAEQDTITRDRIMDILGQVDECYVEEAAPKIIDNNTEKYVDKSNTSIGNWTKWFGLVATIALVIGVSIALWKPETLYVEDKVNDELKSETELDNKRWPQIVMDEEQIGMPEMGMEPNWDTQTISERFRRFNLNDTMYVSRVSLIDEDKIGNELSEVLMEGHDNDGVIHTTKATVYEIQNIDSNCVTAVQFEDSTDYYIYMVEDYQVETIGNLIDNLNLEEYMSINTIRYNYTAYDEEFGQERPYDIKFVNIDRALILDMLLEHRDIKEGITHDDIGDFDMVAYIDIPYIGEEFLGYGFDSEPFYLEHMIYFFDSGYICINFFGQSYFRYFYVGEEVISEFKQYIIDNCEGYEVLYKDSEWYNGNTEEMTTESSTYSVIVYDAISGETYTEIIEKGTGDYSEIIALPYNPNEHQ